MGRPLNKRYFGPLADANDPLNAPKNDEKFNIMVAVKVGTNAATTNGFVLCQRSTTSFLVNDLPNGTKRTATGTGTGNVGTCRLVDKATPADNEMVIVGNLPGVVTFGNITDAVYSGGDITFTSEAHGLSTGDNVEVTGINPSGFNGTYVITSTTANTFIVTGADPAASYVSGGTWTFEAAATGVRIARLFNRTCRDFNNNKYKWATQAVSATETKFVLTSL